MHKRTTPLPTRIPLPVLIILPRMTHLLPEIRTIPPTATAEATVTIATAILPTTAATIALAITAEAVIHSLLPAAVDLHGLALDIIPYPVHMATVGVQHMGQLILPAEMQAQQLSHPRAAPLFVWSPAAPITMQRAPAVAAAAVTATMSSFSMTAHTPHCMAIWPLWQFLLDRLSARVRQSDMSEALASLPVSTCTLKYVSMVQR